MIERKQTEIETAADLDSTTPTQKTKLSENLDLIQTILDFCKTHIKKQTEFKSISTARDLLLSSYIALSAREDIDPVLKYKISDAQANKIVRCEEDVETFTKQLDEAKENLDARISELQTTKSLLNKQIRELEEEKVISVANEESEIIKLRAQRDQDQHALDNAKMILATSFCSCFTCCTKKETLAVATAQNKLDTTNSQILLLEKRIESKQIDKPTADKIRLQISELDSQITNIIYHEQPDTLKKLQAQVNEKIKKCNIAKGEKEKKEELFLTQLSLDTMILYVRSYACFYALKIAIDETYRDEKLKENFSSESGIAQLHYEFATFKNSWDKYLVKFWCPFADDKTASELYNAFSALEDTDKQKFIHGDLSEKLVNLFVPDKLGVQLNYLMRDDESTYTPLVFVPRNPPKIGVVAAMPTLIAKPT